MTPPARADHAFPQKSIRVLMSLDAVGGVWRYALDLASNLRPIGVSVVFAGFGPAPDPAQSAEAGTIGDLVWCDAPLDWLAKAPDELAGVPQLIADLVRAHDIDLVHLNLPSQAAGLSVDVPVVAVSHSCVVTWFQQVRGTEPPEDWTWQRDLNRAGFDRAQRVLAPSRAHAAALQQAYGPIADLEVVYNATRPAASASREQLYAFAAGRWWDDGKNGAALVAAATKCSCPVVMAGAANGPDGQWIDLHGVQTLGTIPHEEVCRRLAEAAIFVSPSRYEPFGLSALEAAAQGTAMVLADIPTYRELWPDAALFAHPESSDAFAAAIDHLAESPDLRHALGQRARERAESFTPAAQAEAMHQHYLDLLNGHLLAAE